MPGVRIAPAQVSSAEERLPRWLKLQIPEVWVRFLLAIAGLALAFGAAMFSTVSRESGNLWATLIFASMALLLATIVGLTTVPYLARRVAASRVRDAFDYDVTAVGIIYVLAVLLIGIAALNTGNNLLYIIVAAMLAAILISGIASAAVLRDLEVELRLPEHVFAGTAFCGAILLRNRRRWVPAFSISVLAINKEKATQHWQWIPSKFSLPTGRPARRQRVQAPDQSGSLKVREFSRQDDRKLRIVFDNPSPGVVPEPAYENAVRLAASLAWHFARENATLSFAAPDYDGVNDIHAFLSYLALVEPAASASLIEAIDISDEYNIILTSRPRASIPAVLWACSYLVFMEGHP